MTFNEINNQRNWRAPLFGYCCSGVVYTEHENPEETMYQVLHHQFVASALAVKAAHRINPEMKSVVCWRWCRSILTPVTRTM